MLIIAIFILSFSQTVLGASPAGQASQNELKPLVVRAQYHFLQGSMGKARELFMQISDQRLHQGWSLKNREYISYALLRLAQTATSERETSKWLQMAWEFDEDLVPDHRLFPPPLVAQWDKLRVTDPPKNFLLPPGYASFDQVLINGRPREIASGMVKTTGGEKHVEFTSKDLQPVVVKISMANLEDYKLPQNQLAPVSTDAELTKSLASPKNFPPQPKASFWRRHKTSLIVGAIVVGAVGAWQATQASQRGSNPGHPTPEIRYSPQTHTLSNQ